MNFRRWLVDTVTVASVASVDSRGQPVLGSQRTVKARIEGERKILKRTNGQEAQTTHMLITADVIALTDRVWLPGASTADVTKAKVPVAVTTKYTKAGNVTMYEVSL